MFLTTGLRLLGAARVYSDGGSASSPFQDSDRRGPPHHHHSYFEGVVLNVPQQRLGEWELLGAVRVPVDDQPREVLQGGEAVGLVHGTLQFQHHRCVLNALLGGLRGGLLLRLPLVRLVLRAHVVLHQARHVGEGREAGPGRGAGVQQELGAAVLDAYAGGTAGGPDRQRQHVERVAAVPNQESPLRSLLQGSVGLSCCYGSPVPSCSERPPLVGSVQADLTRTRTECTRKTALAECHALRFFFVFVCFCAIPEFSK